MPQIELDYLDIFKGLAEAHVDYLVVGGIAVNLHGIPRMTFDIDFIVDMDAANISRLVEKLSLWGFRPRLPIQAAMLADPCAREEWVSKRNMKAFSFVHPEQPIAEIDILLVSPAPFAELQSRALAKPLACFSVPVISIDDLILMKQNTGRAQDAADITQLRKIIHG